MKLIIICNLVLLFYQMGFGQEPSIDSLGKYHYTICIHKRSNIESKILTNVKIDTIATNESVLFGKIQLTDKYALPYSFVNIISEDFYFNKSFMTDSLGNYFITVLPGIYNISFTTIGHEPINLNHFIFTKEQVRNIDILFGDLSSFVTYDYISNKRLGAKKLKRIQKQLAEQ